MKSFFQQISELDKKYYEKYFFCVFFTYAFISQNICLVCLFLLGMSRSVKTLNASTLNSTITTTHLYRTVNVCVHSVRTTAYAQSSPYGQTGCTGLDLRGKRTRARHSIQDLELHERDRRPVDLEIMIHKERRMNGKLLRRE